MIDAVGSEISYVGKVNNMGAVGSGVLADSKTKEREVARLVGAMVSIGAEDGVVVTDDYFLERRR